MPDRRSLLASLLSLPGLAAAGPLAGCAGLAAGSASGRAALLVPQTGRFSRIGQNMVRASRLGVSEDDDTLDLDVRDSGDTPGEASAAAAAAQAGGAEMLLGPLFGSQLDAVLTAAGDAVPVVSFTNDPARRGQGAFLMGLAPDQSVSAILDYARGQGVRRFAVIAPPGALGQHAADTARSVARRTGLELTAALFLQYAGGAREELLAALAPNGQRPDAVLLPEGGETLAGFAELLAGTGIQLLGTAQWTGRRLSEVSALHGAWFVAPDPAAFVPFAETFERRYGETAGLLSGLAYDAAVMARSLAAAGELTREGLLRQRPFPGVVGNFRFAADGSCQRDLAVLTVGGGGARLVDRIPAA